jgi:ABC-type Fe3+-hydroxamate transport system substrate-binding protein
LSELLKAKPELAFLTENAGSPQVQQIQQMGIPVALLKSNSLKNLVERTVIAGQILGKTLMRAH